MNHGKIANPNNRVSLLDRLNNRLARLMGKRDPKQPFKHSVPSNRKFMAIISAMLLSLWLLTGVYYVPDNSYGLLLEQGKVSHVLTGLHIGITWPYPLADVVILDSGTTNLVIGNNSAGTPLPLLTADSQAVAVNAALSYQISNPQRFFLNYYQPGGSQEQLVTWLVMAQIQDYILQHESKWLLQNSIIVSSNEIRQLSAAALSDYGLKLNKLSLNNLTRIAAASTKALVAAKSVTLASLLLTEAKSSQARQQQQTTALVKEYQRLLPQYHANPVAIAELLYYKMLSSLPVESAALNYPLLNLSLAQLQQLEANPSAGMATNPRLLERQVNRQRLFEER